MDLLALYHRLPYPLKVAAASAHGLRLRRWRYDRQTERRIEEAIERESWDRERWAEWQQARRHAVLELAAEHVPAYRGLDPERPEGWPILEKATLRQRPLDFVDPRHRRLYRESTSGTSGTPLKLFWSPATVRAWYALVEARSRLWYGVSRHDRWAILGGQLVARPARTRPPFWVWNAGLRQLYLSSYHLAPRFLPAYLDALERHRVRYLWGYPSALASLAADALEKDSTTRRARGLGLEVAIANAEPVLESQRRLVEQAFGCALRETYGMAELTAAASECEAGRLHLWPEVGHLEILGDASSSPIPSPAPPGETGRLVATGLLATAQPLVRYATGDRLRLSADSTCPCGRRLPLLGAVEGRVDDVIVTPDGRRIGRLDPIFKADLPILEAQIRQKSPRRIEVLYAPAPAAGADLEDRLRARVLERLPGLEVELRAVARIPRGAQGKFRAVVGLRDETEDEAQPS